MDLKASFLAIEDITVQPVEVGGLTLYVKTMTAADRQRLRAWFDNKDPDADSRFVALVACDENGKRVFTDSDVPAISKKAGGTLDPIIQAALKLNGLNSEAVEEKKD